MILFGMDLMASSAKWLSELGMDELNMIHGCQMDSMAELSRAQDITLPSLVAAAPQSSLSSDTAYSSYTTDKFIETRPAKLAKTNSLTSSITTHFDYIKQDPSSPPCTSQILSFNNLDIHKSNVFAAINGAAPYNNDMENTQYALKIGTKRTHHSLTRNPVNAQDHIMAERRRREKISQRFISLTAIVPGLKKMDKASVLGEAIRYVKQLKDRVNELEEQTAKRTVESVVLVKRSQVSSDDESLSSCGGDDNSDGRSEAELPEIEARVSDKDVLIRIHFEKQKGLVVKILSEIEKLHLSVVNSTVLPFGKTTLDMTIIAQKDPKYNIAVRDLVRELRKGLLKFM